MVEKRPYLSDYLFDIYFLGMFIAFVVSYVENKSILWGSGFYGLLSSIYIVYFELS